MATSDERATFETAVEQHTGYRPERRPPQYGDPDNYIYPFAQGAWWAWKTLSAAQQAPQARADERLVALPVSFLQRVRVLLDGESYDDEVAVIDAALAANPQQSNEKEQT